MKQTNKITAAEAAGILEVTAATVKNWQKTGRLGPELTLEAVNAVKAQALHSRRNKAQLRQSQLCVKYISGHERLKKLLSRGVPEKDVPFVLAEAALRSAAPGTNRLAAFLTDELTLGEGDRLINDLLDGGEPSPAFGGITGAPWEAEPSADVLGFIYASALPLNYRRSRGTYYTPLPHSRTAVERAGSGGRILDPCCGSGSFLLAAAEAGADPKNLFAMDIDPMAVKLARLNLYLRRPEAGTDYLYTNITVKDFLTETEKYDLIAGNPPWGGRPERSSAFLLRALELLNDGGRLSLILPQALLTARTHTAAREALLSEARLLSADYIGNVFYGVYCPAVILTAEKGGRTGAEGCRVNGSFTIGRREPDPRCLNLNVTDREYAALKKMRRLKNAVYLKGNADFALGVVTGDNRRLLSDSGEPVIRGTDVRPFEIRTPSVFLSCGLNQCQQAAPEHLYRASEKLVYRFVGRRPVFAVDRLGRLTLNSCNIIVPRVEGLDIDYLAAVLNSTAVGFYMEKTFAAEKWLRWMLEEVPIPMIPAARQREIAASPNWDSMIGELYFGKNGG